MEAHDELDSDFETDERVFHYTTAQGLYGILKSKCLWATHFQFLNDKKEFYVAHDTLIEFVKKKIHAKFAALKVSQQIEFRAGVNIRELSEERAVEIVDGYYKVMFEEFGETYVFSGFCCEPSHRSYKNGNHLHWAAYGRDGGYAIRLDPHKLTRLFEENKAQYLSVGYISGKVVYSSNDLIEKYRADFELFTEVALDLLDAELRKDTSSFAPFKGAAAFQRVTSMLKDSYFDDELEARLVFWRIAEPDKQSPCYPIEVRHKGGVTIPYIEVFKEALFSSNGPIEAIIIGPHLEMARRHKALATYLRSIGLDSIEIIESDVPYVG